MSQALPVIWEWAGEMDTNYCGDPGVIVAVLQVPENRRTGLIPLVKRSKCWADNAKLQLEPKGMRVSLRSHDAQLPSPLQSHQ
jgi:hypothetical protein